MNEFELRRRLGALRAERQPERDLWPAIAAGLAQPEAVAPDAAPARHRGVRYASWAVAAGVALFVLVGAVVGQRRDAQLAEDARSDAAHRVAVELATLDANYQGATAELDRTAPRPPPNRAVPALENASAAVESAEAELRSSLASEPRAEFLLDLLARAKAKQMALERMKRLS